MARIRIGVKRNRQNQGTVIPHTMQFLYETGLLFHINRTVMHPLGLALIGQVSPTTGTVEFAALSDRRSNPNLVFSPVDFAAGVEKFQEYLETRGTETMNLRKFTLGFVTQEVGG